MLSERQLLPDALRMLRRWLLPAGYYMLPQRRALWRSRVLRRRLLMNDRSDAVHYSSRYRKIVHLAREARKLGSYPSLEGHCRSAVTVECVARAARHAFGPCA